MSEITENQAQARAEYLSLTDEEREQIDRRWADVPEDVKDDLRLEIELDLL